MKTCLFIRVWSKEIDWLEVCLRSIKKFSSGFSAVVLCAESAEKSLFKQIAAQYGAVLEDYISPPHRGQREQGYLAAQWASLTADLYVPKGTDFICHMDCDCIFTEPVTPDDYFQDGKPVLLYESYERMAGSPGSGYIWKEGVEAFLKMPTPAETMRRMPAVHYRGMYRLMREFVLGQQNLPRDRGDYFREFCLSRRGEWPPGVCDFNILGAFVMATSAFGDKYAMIDVGVEKHPHNKMRQFWSHGKITEPQDSFVNGRVERVIPAQVHQQLGLT